MYRVGPHWIVSQSMCTELAHTELFFNPCVQNWSTLNCFSIHVYRVGPHWIVSQSMCTELVHTELSFSPYLRAREFSPYLILRCAFKLNKPGIKIKWNLRSILTWRAYVCVCARARVCLCVRARARVCVRVRARARLLSVTS